MNLKDLRYRQKEMVEYYDKKLQERTDKVDHLRAVLKEDTETKKELTLLRKAD